MQPPTKRPKTAPTAQNALGLMRARQDSRTERLHSVDICADVKNCPVCYGLCPLCKKRKSNPIRAPPRHLKGICMDCAHQVAEKVATKPFCAFEALVITKDEGTGQWLEEPSQRITKEFILQRGQSSEREMWETLEELIDGKEGDTATSRTVYVVFEGLKRVESSGQKHV